MNLAARFSGVVVAAWVGLGCHPGPASPSPPPPTTQPRIAARAVDEGAGYVGSKACAACHAEIYDRWKVTPMANVVRDPREHPEAFLADLSTNPIVKVDVKDVAFIYGSRWKQRYFLRSGDDFVPAGVQWDVTHKTWKKYFVEAGTDWWSDLYPPDNAQRPTGPLCDGCHSVGYDVATKKVAEWNVGCEQCHGPGGAHAKSPQTVAILDPKTLDPVDANDTCIQCHSQGRPLENPIQGRYYDWPVGYRVGKRLADYWRLEEPEVGKTTFTHFADGTAHKNRMQGNDFVRSVMYTRHVTCFDCHDVHGTANPAQLKKPAEQICLGCHSPGSRIGPFAKTLEEHTHHAPASPGSVCVACHMPKIETTIGDVKVRAHTFAIVRPSTTTRYGEPNSCTSSCHTEKAPAWAEKALLGWKSVSPWRAP